MKTFKINGEEIGTPSPKSWERRYHELKREYELLEQKYNALSNELSWAKNPDRSGGQFDDWERNGNDGWDRSRR